MKLKVGFICVHNSCRSQMAEDWGLDDPSGGSIEDFRETKNLIKNKVKELINRIRMNEFIAN